MRRLLIVILIGLLTGCTTYIYYGQLQAPDDAGRQQRNLIYWSKTERLLWFDEASGSIRLLSSCSNRTVNFDESEDGIVFRCTPQDEGVEEAIRPKEPCGRVLKYKKIADIPEGEIQLTIFCRAIRDDFTIGKQDYLAASDSVYTFKVVKKEKDYFEQGAPTRPPCEEIP